MCGGVCGSVHEWAIITYLTGDATLMMNHYVFTSPPPLTLSSSLLIRRYALKADNTLIIKKLTLEDEGMFQCLASNEVGEKSAYTWMRVKSKSSISITITLSLSPSLGVYIVCLARGEMWHLIIVIRTNPPLPEISFASARLT